MKPKININHDAKTIYDAMGVDKFEFVMNLAIALASFHEAGKHKNSKIAESIHEILPYEHILFAATAFAADQLRKSSGDVMEIDLTKSYN